MSRRLFKPQHAAGGVSLTHRSAPVAPVPPQPTNSQIEGCPDTNDARHQAAMQALCQVLDSAGQLCMHTAVLHPTNMQKLIASTLDDGRSGVTAEDRTRWAAVTQSLQLKCEPGRAGGVLGAGHGAQTCCGCLERTAVCALHSMLRSCGADPSLPCIAPLPSLPLQP